MTAVCRVIPWHLGAAVCMALTRCASAASCSASSASLRNMKSCLKPWHTSRTRRWNGARRSSSSVDFWYFLISLQVLQCKCRSATKDRQVRLMEEERQHCKDSERCQHDTAYLPGEVASAAAGKAGAGNQLRPMLKLVQSSPLTGAHCNPQHPVHIAVTLCTAATPEGNRATLGWPLLLCGRLGHSKPLDAFLRHQPLAGCGRPQLLCKVGKVLPGNRLAASGLAGSLLWDHRQGWNGFLSSCNASAFNG